MLFCRCLGACFPPSATVDLLTSVTTATSCLSRYRLSSLLWDQGLFGIFWPDSHRISFRLLHCSVCQFPCKCYENWQYGPDTKGKGLIQTHFFLFWKLLRSTPRWQGGDDVSQKNAFLIIWLQSALTGSIHSPGVASDAPGPGSIQQQEAGTETGLGTGLQAWAWGPSRDGDGEQHCCGIPGAGSDGPGGTKMRSRFYFLSASPVL